MKVSINFFTSYLLLFWQFHGAVHRKKLSSCCQAVHFQPKVMHTDKLTQNNVYICCGWDLEKERILIRRPLAVKEDLEPQRGVGG